MAFRRRVFSILSAVGAVALLAALFLLIDIDTGTLFSEVLAFDPGSFLLVTLLTLAIMFCSQERWQILQAHYPSSSLFSRRSTFMYTCVGASLAQIIPPHISTGLARSMGSWFEKRSRPLHSIAFTLIEQLFDLLISLVILVSCLLFLSGQIAFSSWIGLTVISTAVLLIPLVVISAKTPYIGAFIVDRVGTVIRLLPQQIVDTLPALSLPTGKVTAKLYGLSILRFIALVARATVISYSALAAFNWWEISTTVPVMQLSGLIPITPGSLGITEWAWSSVISALDIPLATAAQFALLHRIVALAAQLIVTLFSIIVFTRLKQITSTTAADD